MIVPNPESALNEEAGKLLLEQYDDYAKRARLYTSIQAKSGKQEFLQLEKERLKSDVIEKSVLKPVSNTIKKRKELEETEEKEVKKVKKNNIIKKKALRRL